MTRRSVTEAEEAIDAIESPTDGLEDGSLTITSQSTGPVTGIFKKEKSKFYLMQLKKVLSQI